ncbi:MAG: squalene--hopene cyclase [Planctomycetales bacterium]|nr:squalene--hopene cyclase [Planctomycetales bacterium]MBN8625490.1 squalene--hopene cyclase [Planctomycetota bacterium]
MIDRPRLLAAYAKAREVLLAERVPEGHWVGELSSSALSTATAVSALSIAARHADVATRTQYEALIAAALQWIFARQNPDGGWGDTDKSLSNISTTMLVRAAAHLAEQTASTASRERERPESYVGSAALQRAEDYIAAQGGIPGLRRRYGRDKTFAVPILTNCALAGLVPWREVSALPFEAACLPQSWYRFARLPVVSYAIPALVAIGQAKYFHDKPWNPIARGVRALSINRSLSVLQKMQPASGGFLEATPLTSFVVMSLASIGRHDHPVTQLGLKFLVDSVRPDGSWPIDTNLATWVTTLSINALGTRDGTDHLTPQLLDWLLSCQHTERHPFTGADPGGWGWTDLSGAVPDADDTPGAMLALHGFRELVDWEENDSLSGTLRVAHHWLLALQNSDGGCPTFCRGWGKLPFDRSGTDLTAHVIRTFPGFLEDNLKYDQDPAATIKFFVEMREGEIRKATKRGFNFLRSQQRSDGSWLPLWFGNQWGDDDENPLYGTARVLLAYRDLGRMGDVPAMRGIDYLLTKQNADGGWGGPGINGEGGMGKAECRVPAPNTGHSPFPIPTSPFASSVEETAVVVEALCAAADHPEVRKAVERGALWLVEAVETGRSHEPSPIGFYFAKLWYYEKLYPLIFTVGALRAVVELGGHDTQLPASGLAPSS